jgi:basic amino acid/polyamine antiporter, APA family
MNGISEDQKPVSLFSATIIVIANMIGTGVFTTLGLQVASLHTAFPALMLWVVGGVGAFCGALCYGELGAMMPRSGGEYTYLSTIYHPAVGFLSGWVSMVAGFAAPVALAAIALGEYAGAVFPGADKMVLALTAIVFLSLVHLVDVRFGCHFQNCFTVGKVLLIFSFIISGFFAPNPQRIDLLPSGDDLRAVFSPDFATSLVYVFYAYSGWNASAYIAGEISKPEKNLPLSLFLGASLVSVCYLLINYVFLYTVPISELSGKIDVGYLSAKSIFGVRGSTAMTLLICLALLSSLSSMIMVGPRVTQVMGEDLPALRVFAKRNDRGVPVRTIVLQSSIALFLVATSTFEVVLTYVGFLLALFALMTVLGVFVLRAKKSDVKRPFKTWGYPVTPLVFLLLNGWMLCYLMIERPLPSLGGLLTVACGLMFYWLFATRHFTRTAG